MNHVPPRYSASLLYRRYSLYPINFVQSRLCTCCPPCRHNPLPGSEAVKVPEVEVHRPAVRGKLHWKPVCTVGIGQFFQDILLSGKRKSTYRCKCLRVWVNEMFTVYSSSSTISIGSGFSGSMPSILIIVHLPISEEVASGLSMIYCIRSPSFWGQYLASAITPITKSE